MLFTEDVVSFNADPLSLRKKRSGTKLERTSLSTGVFLQSASGGYPLPSDSGTISEMPCRLNSCVCGMFMVKSEG